MIVLANRAEIIVMTSVNLAIVGLGRGFMLTLPALRDNPAVRLRAAFSLRTEPREHFAKQFDAIACDSFESLLALDEIDAVYIATPHEIHAEQTIAAVRAGKHVLVEKPMAIGLKDCMAMEAAAQEAGKIIIVGPSHGFDAPIQKAAELVASGEFGAFRMITTFNFTDFMYRPRRPEELDTSRGGGVVYSQAAHQIDLVRRIAGLPVSSIRATAANWDPKRPSEGAYSALMTFEGGAWATMTYSGYAHYDVDELVGWISELGFDKDPQAYGAARRRLANMSPEDEIAAKVSRTYGPGSESDSPPRAPHHEHFGYLLVSCDKADLKVTPTEITVYGNSERQVIDIPPPRLPRVEVIDEFVGAITGEITPVHNGRWGVDTMACCEALLESSRTGEEISPGAIINNLSF